MKSWHIKLRSLARRTGVIRVIHKVRALRPRDYEEQVNAVLRGAIVPGDVVWDIGANVGVYTEQFCQWVGPAGYVMAFEPFSGSCEAIRQRLPGCEWLSIENIALSDTDTTARFATGENSTTNHLVTEDDHAGDTEDAVVVTVSRGDTVAERVPRLPNVIKVDVEGFEEEVLAGLEKTLTAPCLRAVLVEVHFRMLEERGRANAPVRLEKLLRNRGFRATWVDASHLFAAR